MNAQISFLDGTYTLIHVPLDLYNVFLQPMLRVLMPQTQSLHVGGEDGSCTATSTTTTTTSHHDFEGLSAEKQHGFLNVSVTPLECSIVCHTAWAEKVFEPVINSLPPHKAKAVSVFTDSYMVLSVISAGLDAASRVLELSSPLALAGIPIFFITTYYSDFILVPRRERHNVIAALHERGFELSADDQSSFVASSSRKNSSTGHNHLHLHQHQHQHSPSSSSSSPPGTPPPSNKDELQSRTFRLLQRRSVAPRVDHGLELVQCSGREMMSAHLADAYGGGSSHHRSSLLNRGQDGAARDASWIDKVDTKLYTSIISVLVSQPRFVSVTLAQEDPPSLLLDKSLLDMFSDSLVGDTDNILVPIFLDLVNLPSQVTGIVCGVSGRLVDDMNMAATSELSYLSTARAGIVIMPKAQIPRALSILRPLLEHAE